MLDATKPIRIAPPDYKPNTIMVDCDDDYQEENNITIKNKAYRPKSKRIFKSFA